MYKKSISRCTSSGKKGQITIFMILGLLILIAFIFVYSLTAGIKKGQLQEAQEKTLTKVFKKEALRIFVEDCLTDELEKGLILLGQQGRLWDDQVGGTRHFEEGVTGLTVGDHQVFYAITTEKYPKYQNAYPCLNDTNPTAPEFCRYAYPNDKVGFGSLELRSTTLEGDLRRYLANRTVWCVGEFTKHEISGQATIETQEADLELGIFEEGIDVRINYPLKLHLGEEEFFHLSQFDFFYPTQFKKLLDAAVSFPLRMDWQYVDFGYNKTTLESSFFTYGSESEAEGGDCSPFKNFFLCKLALRSDQYASLGIELQRQEIGGDTLFTFQAPAYTILNKPELYTYRFARQNRPPALDYVSRMACPTAGYDYLVVKDDEELGIISFNLSAQDADEDKVNYFVGNIPKQEVISKPVQEGLSTLSVSAEDEHDAKDWQDVRVLVDRPLDLKILLDMDYSFWSNTEKKLKKYAEVFFSGELYYVSNEDPVFFNLQFPGKSQVTEVVNEGITINYTNIEGTESFEEGWSIFGGNTIDLCIGYPWKNNCKLDVYNKNKNTILNWEKLLDAKEDGYFKEASKAGTLNLSYQGQYCALFDKTESTEVTVVVKECVPHRNPAFPWAFNPTGNYHKYKYGLSPEGTTNFNDFKGLEEINPFEATHSCCVGIADHPAGWRLATDEDDPCFINPEEGCYGQVLRDDDGTPYTGLENTEGYVLEQQQRFCKEERGNICDGNFKNELYNKKLWCGSGDYEGCRETIPTSCQEGLAFRIVNENGVKGWCSGTFGCENFCSSAVVYTGGEEQKVFTSAQINAIATQLQVESENDVNFKFKCGCEGKDGEVCDGNFDEKFNGVCQAGVCADDI
ncbi:MAG TPA: hypothetical protein VJA18_04675 [Candidatus Nanoarchaeia archaeon]|nr:hypothetical protein [Candidatus Nanoarchaeia archaeon]